MLSARSCTALLILLYLTIILLSFPPRCVPIRLFNPNLSDRIQHFHLSPTHNPARLRTPQYDDYDDFFTYECSIDDIEWPFPIFLCPLWAVLSQVKEEKYAALYNDTTTAIAELQKPEMHPCYAFNKSTLVLFLPPISMMFGCTRLVKNASDMTHLGGFHVTAHMPHRFSEPEPCVFDQDGKELCTLNTIFIDNFIFFQERRCCCPSGVCITILHDQAEPEMPLPILQIVVDADRIEVANKDHYQEGDDDCFTVKRIRVEHHDIEEELEKLRKQNLLRKARDIVVDMQPSAAPVLILMPLFIIIFCLFCAVVLSNVCQDNLMEELHSSGLDVIRSEEGGVKKAPRDYEF